MARRWAVRVALVIAIVVAVELPLVGGRPMVAHAAPSIQTDFPLPTGGFYIDPQTGYYVPLDPPGEPTGIAVGSDGNIWADESGTYINRLTPSGTLTPYLLPGLTPWGSWALAAGPDGNLWFTQRCYERSDGVWINGQIGVTTTSGVTTYFAVPGADSHPPYDVNGNATCGGPDPYGIASGPDGNLWFTERASQFNSIGRMTPSGTVTTFAIPTAASDPRNITAGPDGNLWFVEAATAKIARITPAGLISEFPIAANAQPHGIAAGPDGRIWFTESGLGMIGVMSVTGAGYSEFATPTTQSQPEGIASGPGGAMWVAEHGASVIARISMAGSVTEYPITASAPFGIAAGPDGNVWYTSGGNVLEIGRLPVAPCDDPQTTISDSRVGPGASVTVSVTVSNCGTPTLTNLTTASTITPPPGCGAAPTIPSFTSTLTYGQSTPPHAASFVAPSCVGPYLITTRSTAGSSVVSTSTTNFVVSNGTGSRIVGDFNGDGYADLAVYSNNIYGTGNSITVYYGSASGLSLNGTQVFTPTSAGMPPQAAGPSSTGGPSRFGWAMTAADFDRDGYSDLAVGMPWLCDLSNCAQMGAVVVLHGSRVGLTTQSSQFIAPPPSNGTGDWGWLLRSADFNGDDYPDLAVSTGTAVTVMYGSASGVALAQTVFTKSSPGMPGPQPGTNDWFGFSLATGDFNGDGFADLAVGDTTESATYILRGSASGLTTTGSQFLPAIGPRGSFALAAGDFNGDGYTDLAVGDPYVSHSDSNDIVEVHYGSASGLGSTGYGTAQRFSPTKSGMPVSPLPALFFGVDLAVGDFNHDGRDDLAVGTLWVGNHEQGIYVLNGGAVKLGTKGSRLILSGDSGGFWPNLAAADLNGDGFADLFTSSLAQPTKIYNGARTGVSSTPSASVAGGHYSAPGSPDLQACC